jgi:hypothetical protein
VVKFSTQTEEKNGDQFRTEHMQTVPTQNIETAQKMYRMNSKLSHACIQLECFIKNP